MRKLFSNRGIIVALLVAVAMLLAACGAEEAAVSAGTDPTGNPWTEGQDLSGTEVVIFGAYVDEDASRFQAAM
ncbi:MAG: carbohydrate ABC transporter substrate-binding protein, partial [Spirochaetaceae bacterium]